MPKASSSSQPPHHRQSMASDQDADSPSYSHDDSPNNGQPPSPRTAAIMRKRKNADAQAAFRARRANYIANLEETVTSLENAVRRLQDALRDARDESNELKVENQRLIGLLDTAGIDHRRQSGDVSLLRPNPSTTSLQNSPSPADFSIAYGAGGVQSGSAMSGEQQPLDAYSPFYNPSGSLPPSDFLTQQNVAAQGAGGSNPHSRQVSLDSQGHSPGHFDAFGIARPGSAASGTSSHSSAHSFHGVFENPAELEPAMSAGKAPPGLQMGFDELNLYGNNPMTAMPSGGNGSSPWNAAFIAGNGSNDQQLQQSEQQETELGRSDTVKASDPRHMHRRVHSHGQTTTANASSLPSIPQTQSIGPQGQPQSHDMYNSMVDDPSSSFEFDPYGAAAQAAAGSRPGSSASSLLSNEGEIGHHFHHHHPQLHQHHSQQQPSMTPEMDDGAYYSSEGDFNDMDFMEGMDSASGGMALVDSLMVPSHPGSAGFSGGMDPSAMGLSSSPMGSNLSSGGSPFAGMFPAAAMAGGNMAGLGMPGHPSALNAGMGISGMDIVGGGVGPGGVPGPGSQQVPMSSTLAVIKAQAFGTSRKARTRAKRPGADSAAKVAMEALQARAQGLGLDVDLRAENEGSPGAPGGANVSRSGATVKRKPKSDEAPKG